MNDIEHTKLRWLYSAKLSKRYLVHGRYHKLKKHLRFMQPWRQRIERVALFFQRFWPFSSYCQDPSLNRAWRLLRSDEGLSISAAFLLDTHWYKQSWFVGPVIYNNNPHFLKVFKEPQDVSIARKQARFASDHFAQFFRVANIVKTGSSYVMQELIERDEDNHPAFHELYDASYEFSAAMYEGHTQNLRRLDTLLPLDLPVLFEKDGRNELWENLKEYLNKDYVDTRVPAVPVHGDFTSWNSFRDLKGQIAIVDYERSGWQSPFYDCFHLVCQAPVLAGKPVYPDQLIRQISDRQVVPQQTVQLWFILYLLDQLHYDMTSYYTDGQAHSRLARSIRLKCYLLNSALKASD